LSCSVRGGPVSSRPKERRWGGSSSLWGPRPALVTDVVGRMSGSHATDETAYAEVFTVIHDLAEGRDLAWVRSAIWPPVGTVVELSGSTRWLSGSDLCKRSARRSGEAPPRRLQMDSGPRHNYEHSAVKG
jgi:hypothetical protein